MSEFLSFELERQQVPVFIRPRWYVLREMDGRGRSSFVDKQSQVMRMANGKPVGLRNVGELEPELLAMCLHEAEVEQADDGPHVKSVGNLVPIDTIRGWPARTIGGLFEKAQEINGLTASTKDEEKNA